MNIFDNSRGNYEPIEPVPRRGQRKMLNYILVGIGIVALATVSVVVVIHMTSSTSEEVPMEPNIDNSDNGTATTEKDEGTAGSLDNSTVVLTHRLALTAPAPEDVHSTTIEREDPLVTLDAGQLRGTYLKSRAGRDYLAFLGVPYAKPPLGELRFQLPVEVEPWEDVLNTTQLPPDCIQKDKYNPEEVTKGSEDCLYLNIYTPKNFTDFGGRRNRFPVLFYIHGGGPFGSGTRYGADYFMDENVVLITIHYRLGILGNLNTNDTEARGNQGLKDQVMALQWVKDNIRKFGGDNGKVTLFGNSYGSMQVAGHLLSPMSKGIFHRIVAQSGTLFNPGMFRANTRAIAFDLGEKLNCTGNSSSNVEFGDLSTKDLVTCFRNLDVSTLVLHSYKEPFEISIELPAEDENVFLSDTPLGILQSGNMNPVPAMYGTASGEGLFTSLPILSFENVTTGFNENWQNASIETLQLESASDPVKIVNAAREFYFGSQNLSRAVQGNLTDLISDRTFVHPTQVFASFQLEANNRRQDVFLYYFDKDADKTYAQSALDVYGNDTFLGAGHADELQFMFPYDPYPYIPEGSKNANFSKMLVRLWTTFADTGTPTGSDNNAEWIPIDDPKPYRWFRIDDEPEMVDFLGPRMNFWDQFNLTEFYK